MSGRFFEVDDAQIYFEDHGSGDPILFIHGFTLDHTMWNEQVKYFSKNYRVITFDLRGFGQSSLPTSKYSYSNDIYNLLKFLNISKAHVVGLSLGGEEAINFALEHPDMIITLSLVSSSLGGYGSTVDWDVKVAEQGLEQGKLNWINHPVFSSSKNYPETFENIKNMVNNYSGWHWLNSGFRIRPSTPAIEQIDILSCPVLVVIGELDLQYYHDIGNIFSTKIRGVKKIVVAKCGHMLTMENPEYFNNILSEFLSTNK